MRSSTPADELCVREGFHGASSRELRISKFVSAPIFVSKMQIIEVIIIPRAAQMGPTSDVFYVFS